MSAAKRFSVHSPQTQQGSRL